jgi:hypothetical protein
VVDPRSPAARLGALAAAVLVVVGSADRAYAASHCPHHGALPAAPAHAHGAAAPERGAPGTPHAHCTCIGACAPGASFTLAPGVIAALLAPPPARATATAATPAPIFPTRRDHQLPFATAPPTDR